MVKYLTEEEATRLVSRAEDQTLREIAEISGAKFVRAESDQQVDDVMEDILIQGRPIAGYQSQSDSRGPVSLFSGAAFACLIAGIFHVTAPVALLRED